MAMTTFPRGRRSTRRAMLPAPESVRSATALRSSAGRSRLPRGDYFQLRQLRYGAAAQRQFADPIKVLNPIASNLDVMRTTLLGGLLEVLRTNVNRKLERVRVFEAGRCFVREDERYDQPLRIGGLAFGPALRRALGWRHARSRLFRRQRRCRGARRAAAGDHRGRAAPGAASGSVGPCPRFRHPRSAGSANCTRGWSAPTSCPKHRSFSKSTRMRSSGPAFRSHAQCPVSRRFGGISP